jgi:cell wall-associated NlpC family hydrolase
MYNEVEKFLGIGYEKNKRDFKSCDCYGLCYLFNKDVLGIDIAEYVNENIYNNEELYETYQSKKKYFREINKGKEVSGDIVYLSIKGHAIHVGVVISKGTMLHIMEGRQSVVESYNSDRWENKVNSFWRYESTK